jgi:hypothetical protein
MLSGKKDPGGFSPPVNQIKAFFEIFFRKNSAQIRAERRQYIGVFETKTQHGVAFFVLGR